MLLLIYRDLSALSELAANITSSCSFEGDYDRTKIPPESLKFNFNQDKIRILEECVANRNTPNWFLYCEELCE